MAPFRGSDEILDHEIETLEAIARLRVRRVARELRELDRDLRELRRERARRRAAARVPAHESTAEVPELA
ncbi:MAG: hypothetical protein L3K14_05810 [Thermoplasmata archaeon]|nr:hypothetical protein [Thermoplasmata archaeon]